MRTKRDGMEQWKRWLEEHAAFTPSPGPQETRAVTDLEGYESRLDSFAAKEEAQAPPAETKSQESEEGERFVWGTLKNRPYWR